MANTFSPAHMSVGSSGVYDENSWGADKVPDVPKPRYASRDRATIERHVSQAQGAGIDALLEVWPIFEAFQAVYVSKGLLLDAEKNASAPSPTGTSAEATATARPARKRARTARRG